MVGKSLLTVTQSALVTFWFLDTKATLPSASTFTTYHTPRSTTTPPVSWILHTTTSNVRVCLKTLKMKMLRLFTLLLCTHHSILRLLRTLIKGILVQLSRASSLNHLLKVTSSLSFLFIVIILVTRPGILNQTCWTEPKFLVSFDDFGFLRKNYNQTIPITPT